MDNLKAAMGNTEGFLSETLFATRAQWKMQLPLAKVEGCVADVLLSCQIATTKLSGCKSEWHTHAI